MYFKQDHFHTLAQFHISAQDVNLKKLGHFAIDESFEKYLKGSSFFGVYTLCQVGEIEPLTLRNQQQQ